LICYVGYFSKTKNKLGTISIQELILKQNYNETTSNTSEVNVCSQKTDNGSQSDQNTMKKEEVKQLRKM